MQVKQWIAAGVLLFGAVASCAQDYGDTPYVQTPQVVVDKMLEMAKVTSKDYLIDLGSGDGRLIITAARKYGARGFGVDLNKSLVTLSNRNAAKAGVANRAVFYERDLHETDITKADVLTIYLLPEVNLMVRPRILALKPGTRLVSHDYGFGEWPPDIEITMDAPGKPVGRDQKSKVMFWVVPSRVAGKWSWQHVIDGKPQTFELSIDQVFQKISGTLAAGGRPATIENALLTGDTISFEAHVERGGSRMRLAFSGKVVNNAIEGEARGLPGPAGAVALWSASRTELREPRFTDLKPMPMAR
jgi:SAM-dependent methyltransferase